VENPAFGCIFIFAFDDLTSQHLLPPPTFGLVFGGRQKSSDEGSTAGSKGPSGGPDVERRNVAVSNVFLVDGVKRRFAEREVAALDPARFVQVGGYVLVSHRFIGAPSVLC